ncbi:unnamed protein product, partial [Rotaria sp. Silwood1]
MLDYNIRYQGNCENFFEHPKSFACAVGLHHGDTTEWNFNGKPLDHESSRFVF